MSFMYKSMGAKRSKWQLSQKNQYVSYALLSLRGSIFVNISTLISCYWNEPATEGALLCRGDINLSRSGSGSSQGGDIFQGAT